MQGMETDTNRQPESNWLLRVLIGKRPQRTLLRIVLLVAVCTVLFRYVLLPIRVDGASMLPTYQNDAVNFVNRLAYVFHPPQRGDVVAIRLAGDHLMYMKRIVGLPGETVAWHEGRVYINGRLLDEPYVKKPCDWEHAPEQVGPDEYFVVGDNRSMDYDRHTKGRPNRNRIVGKVLL